MVDPGIKVVDPGIQAIDLGVRAVDRGACQSRSTPDLAKKGWSEWGQRQVGWGAFGTATQRAREESRLAVGPAGALARAVLRLHRVLAQLVRDDRALFGRQAEWIAQTAPGKPRWIFLDPLTGCALRCRDDVQRDLDANAAWSRAANENNGDAQFRTAALITLPFTAAAMVLALPAIGVKAALGGPTASEHRARAAAARKRGALGEAVDEYFLAWQLGDREVLQQLAQIWVEQGAIPEAKQARLLLRRRWPHPRLRVEPDRSVAQGAGRQGAHVRR